MAFNPKKNRDLHIFDHSNLLLSRPEGMTPEEWKAKRKEIDKIIKLYLKGNKA